MHANVQLRICAATGDMAPYYRLKESYRDVRGVVHSLIVLNIGFEPELTPKRMHKIAHALTARFQNRNQPGLFDNQLAGLDETEALFAEKYWWAMIDNGQIDRFNKREDEARKEAERFVDLNTVKHTDVREVGAEWLCKQAIDQLGIGDFLERQGWSKTRTDAALSHLIVRTVYAPSEWATHRVMTDNSAACELYHGQPGWTPGVNSLYTIPDKLFEIKEQQETHLCQRTDHLFNLRNSIALFDLANFYFEGSKRGSGMAKFGRSKEKRYDCKLLVLALCINAEGFIRYSSILEGNTADPQSLPDMIEKLSGKSPAARRDTLVVIDAGIATEENLRLIKQNGFNYLCVSRSKPKDYTLADDNKKVIVCDTRKRGITLREVKTDPSGDYILEITSPSKAMTEASMCQQWKDRFETELQRINDGIAKKGGTKNYEKVIERTGRALQRHPSIAKFYDITYVRSEETPSRMARVDWQVKDFEGLESGHGVYFLRTNVRTFDERTTWEYYNLIREIECTNRQLKTDLNLRPVYHQKDGRCEAHLFFGLLSYWVVNTIRLQLKRQGEPAFWTEIVRRMRTQKLVTTTATNALGEQVKFRMCSEPSQQAKDIYRKLGYKEAPFKKIKICRTHEPPN